MHIHDSDLILFSDGALPASREAHVRHHLSDCAHCRERLSSLSDALTDAVVAHHALFSGELPPLHESAARLHTSMATAVVPQSTARLQWAAAAAVVILMGSFLAWRSAHHTTTEFAPDHAATPGAIRAIGRDAVCSGVENPQRPPVQAEIAQAVFHRYGIAHPAPGTYEVDYLIPPALGGSDDPRNLWPQPYSTGVWNARVKDALEDRLHSLVCSGRIDLLTAQRDLSRDWIAAYKKYFRTDRPLLDHAAFVKDRPWE